MIKGIKHIIFDLGGVLLNIDYSLTEQAFRSYGFEDFNQVYSQLKQESLFDDIETGRVSTDEFVAKIQQKTNKHISRQQVIDSWNAMLLDMPMARLELLQQLRLHYDLILLSNTNEIHEAAFNIITQSAHGVTIASFFDRVYYSHRVGMRKPDIAIFERILEECNFSREKTLFIDDSPQHIEAAKSIGIQTIYLEKGMTIEDTIFRPKTEE